MKPLPIPIGLVPTGQRSTPTTSILDACPAGTLDSSRSHGVQVQERLEVDREAMEYYPSIFFNDFWILKDHLIPMNDTVIEVVMHISLGTLSSWKWQIYAQMEQSFSMQVQSPATLPRVVSPARLSCTMGI